MLQKYTAASKKYFPNGGPQTENSCHAASEHFSSLKQAVFSFLCTLCTHHFIERIKRQKAKPESGRQALPCEY